LHVLAREAADQVRAEEAGGSCDQQFHRVIAGKTGWFVNGKAAAVTRASLGVCLRPRRLTLPRAAATKFRQRQFEQEDFVSLSETTTTTTLPKPATSNERVNILMVDDSREKLLAMESILDSLGQNLVKAFSGPEALRLLLKQEFAVILLDVNMPGMDGFETASMIRQRQSLEHIPILFVTALSTTDADIFKGYAYGAVDYVLTPILPEILRTKVGVFVELWKQKRALQEQAASLKQLNQDLVNRAEDLSNANKELESFCYTIAHDLRAPLRAMEGLTAALVDDFGDHLDDMGHQSADRIRQSAARMDQMIQELLSYSRLSFVQLELHPVRMDDVVKDAINQIDFDLRQKKARLQVKRSRHRVIGHQPMLVQVMSNLITNAVKFCAEGMTPEVIVREERRGEFVRMWVEDNGIGILPEHSERIFRIFERLHDRDKYSGTGIGLAIVQKAISRMGGKVGVESEVGRGSRFWFELPISREAEKVEEPVEEVGEAAKAEVAESAPPSPPPE
jgi:two-component system, sensor histidine kinase and response regulator